MRLYIARHGEASFNAESDRSRALTVMGTHATEVLYKKHHREVSSVAHVWSSPLKRAQQTAEILSGYQSERIETHEILAPDEEPEQVLKALQVLPENASVLIVSHQPLVGDLVSLLRVGNLFEPHPFVTSEIVVMELDALVPGAGAIVADYMPGA